MKAGPEWGRYGVLQLNWVFDEYFVRPEIWAKVFQPFGVRCAEVLNTQETALRSVVQLKVEAEAEIVGNGLSYTKCDTCGRVKYFPVVRGMFPSLASMPSAQHLGRRKSTLEVGASGNKAVLISRKLAQSLIANDVSGVSFVPSQVNKKSHEVPVG